MLHEALIEEKSKRESLEEEVANQNRALEEERKRSENDETRRTEELLERIRAESNAVPQFSVIAPFNQVVLHSARVWVCCLCLELYIRYWAHCCCLECGNYGRWHCWFQKRTRMVWKLPEGNSSWRRKRYQIGIVWLCFAIVFGIHRCNHVDRVNIQSEALREATGRLRESERTVKELRAINKVNWANISPKADGEWREPDSIVLFCFVFSLAKQELEQSHEEKATQLKELYMKIEVRTWSFGVLFGQLISGTAWL